MPFNRFLFFNILKKSLKNASRNLALINQLCSYHAHPTKKSDIINFIILKFRAWSQVWSQNGFYSVDFLQSKIISKSGSLQTHNQLLRQSYFTVSWPPLCRALLTWQYPLCASLNFKMQVTRQCSWPLKGAVSMKARNGLQGPRPK